MKFLSSTLSLASLALLMASCRAADIEQSNEGMELSSWKMSLQMGSLQLSDNSAKSAKELSLQVLNRIRAPSFFRDPTEKVFYGANLNTPLMASFLVSSQKLGSTEYRWTNKFNASTTPSFGICSSELSGARQYISCENKRVLECLGRRAELQTRYQDGQTTSTADSSLLMQWLKSCDVSPQFANILDGTVFFKIESKQVFFSPTPLSSVLIYKGSWANYEDAQVQATAVATLPQVSECNRADGSCLVSPVPLSQCIGCSSLEKGKIHTVFFFEGLRQDYISIKSLLFVPE